MSALADVYRGYLAALNDRRLDELGDYVHDTIGFNGEPTSRAAYAAAIQSNLDVVPDFRWAIEHLVEDGDLLAVHLTDTGTPAAEWLGIAATGRSFATTEMAIYRFQAGKIAEMWFVLDAPRAAAQVAEGIR